MKKTYIAGRISNYEGYKEHFKREEEKLKEKGHIVLNPVIAETGQGMSFMHKNKIIIGEVRGEEGYRLINSIINKHNKKL